MDLWWFNGTLIADVTLWVTCTEVTDSHDVIRRVWLTRTKLGRDLRPG